MVHSYWFGCYYITRGFLLIRHRDADVDADAMMMMMMMMMMMGGWGWLYIYCGTDNISIRQLNELYRNKAFEISHDA